MFNNGFFAYVCIYVYTCTCLCAGLWIIRCIKFVQNAEIKVVSSSSMSPYLSVNCHDKKRKEKKNTKKKKINK